MTPIHIRTIRSVATRILGILACLVLPLGLASCARHDTRESGDDATQVRIAYLSTANFLTTLRDAPFVEEMMSPDTAHFSGPFNPPSDAFQAVQSGQADASSTGTGHFITLISQGAPWVAFAIEYYNGDSQGIVASPGSGVRSLRDLTGKTIAIDRKGATGDYIVHAAFAHAGLDVNAVTIVEMSQNNFAAAFSSGQVDALATYDQNLATALATSGSRLLITGKDYGSRNVSIHMVSSSFAREHPDTVTRLYRTLSRQSDRVRTQPGFIYDTYRALGAGPEVIDRVRSFDVPRILPIDETGLAMLREQARQYMDFGFIDDMPDLESHVIDCTR